MPELPFEIDCRSVKQKLDSRAETLLLDCREADEHAIGVISGSTLLPMSEIAAHLGELEPHRQRHLVIVCHHGSRSLRVTQWLRQQGFDQAQSMTGGIDRWSAEIDPGVPRY